MSINRSALHGIIRLACVAIALSALSLFMGALPAGEILEELHRQMGNRVLFSAAVFVVAYVVLALLMTPGAVLTLAGGALFGIVEGTALVSLASCLAALIAFLIARGVGRRRVEALALRYPIFGMLDRGVGENGWKTVLLLRLSPLLPYSASNYLLGLTPVSTRSYLLASFVGMLPGTLMFVAMGRLGSGVSDPNLPEKWQWPLALVSVLATIVLVVWLGNSAVRSLRKMRASDTPARETTPMTSPRRRLLPTTLSFLLAALCLGGAALWANQNPQELRALLNMGPPVVESEEAYREKADGPVFDHSLYDTLLRDNVKKGGWVDYAGLKTKEKKLQKYIDQLATAKIDEFGRSERLAFLINAYNAFTLKLILEHYPKIKSIRDLPQSETWKKKRWKLGGRTLSLNQIEHEEIRPKFKESRVHWALVCAAVGCPPLRTEAYSGARIESQLEDQAKKIHNSPRWLRLDSQHQRLELTKLYDWYGKDFITKKIPGPIESAARYNATLRKHLKMGRRPTLGWIGYDWRLNDLRNRP